MEENTKKMLAGLPYRPDTEELSRISMKAPLLKQGLIIKLPMKIKKSEKQLLMNFFQTMKQEYIYKDQLRLTMENLLN